MNPTHYCPVALLRPLPNSCGFGATLASEGMGNRSRQTK